MVVFIHVDLISRIIEICDNVGVYRLFQCRASMAIPANRMYLIAYYILEYL